MKGRRSIAAQAPRLAVQMSLSTANAMALALRARKEGPARAGPSHVKQAPLVAVRAQSVPSAGADLSAPNRDPPHSS